MFELTRRTAIAMRAWSTNLLPGREGQRTLTTQIPRSVHGACLVSGGVISGLAYEMTGRPFDVARRTVRLYKVSHPVHGPQTMRNKANPIFRALVNKFQSDGVVSFFRNEIDTGASAQGSGESVLRRRLYSTLRILGRVGPWGVGFLIWEALGPGLTP